MSKYLIEDAFKSLDEVMAENRKTLTEDLGKEDPVKQAALSVLYGYEDGEVTEDGKLRIFATDMDSLDDYKKAVEEEIIDFGKCLTEESVVQDGDHFVGTYSFSILPETDDWEHQKQLEQENECLKEGFDDTGLAEIIEDSYNDCCGKSNLEKDLPSVDDVWKDLENNYFDHEEVQKLFSLDTPEDGSALYDIIESTLYNLNVPFYTYDENDELVKVNDGLEESVKLEERIPKDLINAINHTPVRDRKFSHSDLTLDRGARRRAQVDFENTDYTEVTPDEAKQILKDKSKLSDFYFLVNNHVVKYNDKGECLSDYETWNDPYVRSSGQRLLAVKDWPLNFVIQRADKIYLSNESEHKIDRNNPEYNPEYWNVDSDGVRTKRFPTNQYYNFNIAGESPYLGDPADYDKTSDTGSHHMSRNRRGASGWMWENNAWSCLKKLNEAHKLIKDFKASHDMENLSVEDQEEYAVLKSNYNKYLYRYNELKDDSPRMSSFSNSGKEEDRYLNGRLSGRFSPARDEMWVWTLHQKNIQLYKYYKEQLEKIKKKIINVKEDNFRTQYAYNKAQITNLQEQIDEYTRKIQRLQAQIQEIQAKQTDELKAQDEAYVEDKLDDIADDYQKIKDELAKLFRKTDETNESLNESIDEEPIEGENHYRIYLLSTEGEESFNDENDIIDSDDNCIELAKQYYNQEDGKFDRVVACKININGEDQEVIELWDSQDDDLKLTECNKQDLQEAVFKNIEAARLQEAKAFNLKDEKELIDAEAYKNIDDKEDDILVAVDPSLESEDQEYEPHVGDALLQCKACRTIITKKTEEIVKDGDTDTYNIDEACPHCGAKDGFKYIAQLSSPESEDAKEEITDEGEPKEEEQKVEETEEVIEEPKEEKVEDEFDVEELQEESFDRLINNHLTSLYENVKSYKTNNLHLDGNKLIVEGVLTSDKNKVLNTQFTFNISKDNDKYLLEGVNDIFGIDDNSLIFNCKVEDKKIICEDLKINNKEENK